MTTLQEKLVNHIRSLEELGDVTVEVSDDLGHIQVSHRRHHVADFKFKWLDGKHYAGYFVDGDGRASQAIVSLRTSMDAIKFVVLYSTLVEISAKR